ncbi:hypothetical protein Lser_V15G40702 [Lactuca serriola]
MGASSKHDRLKDVKLKTPDKAASLSTIYRARRKPSATGVVVSGIGKAEWKLEGLYKARKPNRGDFLLRTPMDAEDYYMDDVTEEEREDVLESDGVWESDSSASRVACEASIKGSSSNVMDEVTKNFPPIIHEDSIPSGVELRAFFLKHYGPQKDHSPHLENLSRRVEDVKVNDYSNFTLLLKKLIERGKVNLKDVASEINVSANLLASNLVDDSLPPDLHGRIVKWLKGHAHVGGLQKKLKLKLMSPCISKAEKEYVALENNISAECCPASDLLVNNFERGQTEAIESKCDTKVNSNLGNHDCLNPMNDIPDTILLREVVSCGCFTCSSFTFQLHHLSRLLITLLPAYFLDLNALLVLHSHSSSTTSQGSIFKVLDPLIPLTKASVMSLTDGISKICRKGL